MKISSISSTFALLQKGNQNYNDVSPHTGQKAIIKKPTNNKRQRGYGEKKTLPHCWQECKMVQPLWRTVLFVVQSLSHAQLCNSMGCSVPGSSVHGFSPLPFPSPEHLPHPGIKPASPALAGQFFTTESWRRILLQGRPREQYGGSLEK